MANVTKVTPKQHYKDVMRLIKRKPSKSTIPISTIKMIQDNDLLNISNVDERAKMFLKAMYNRRLKSVTVIKYFNLLKPVLFPNTNIVPNSLIFDDNYQRPLQHRGGNLEHIKNLINYIKFEVDDTCEYKWPFLISSYSGLRTNEVCNIKMSHLSQLVDRKSFVTLKTKNNEDWEVTYYEEFDKIIALTISHNKRRYELYKKRDIDTKLFPHTTQALHLKLKHFYLLANKEHPPIGFGLHSLRYYLATIMYNATDKIEISQALLGHKNPKTTERYIKQDPLRRKKELDNIARGVPLYREIKFISSRI